MPNRHQALLKKRDFPSAAEAASSPTPERERPQLVTPLGNTHMDRTNIDIDKDTIESLLAQDATTIRFRSKDAIDGFSVLFRHGQVGMVGKDTYVVGPDHLRLLKRAGI